MPAELIFWHKGLAYDTRSALQQPGFLKTADNISFKTEGKQGLRTKFSSINSNAVNAIHSIKRFEDTLLIGDSTYLRHRSALTDGDFTSLGSSFANSIWQFHQYKDFLVGVNGGAGVMFDTSGNLYPTTIDNPTDTPAGAAGAAGNPDGTYALYVTFLITFPNGAKYETGFSPTSEVTVATKKISWTNIPVSTYEALSGTAPTIHRKLYRGPGAGGSLADIYYVHTIEDNTTTTYTDNDSDSTIGANDASWVDDYEPGPTNMKFHQFHYGRWYVVDADHLNRVYYSEAVSGETGTENEALMPLAFEDGNWDDIRTAGVEKLSIMSMISWGTYLYFPLKHTWLRKDGNDPDNWNYKKTWSENGIAAPHTICKCGKPAGLLGVSNPLGGTPGISLFNGQLSQIITSPKFDYIFEDDLNQDAIGNCRADWDGTHYHLLYPSGTATQPDKWAAFDLSRYPDVRLAFWKDLNGQSVDVDRQSSKIYIGGSDGYVRQNSGLESLNIDIRTHDLIGGKEEYSNHIKTLKELKYAINTGNEDVTLEIYIDGIQATWPDGDISQAIKGADDTVQYIRSFPNNFAGYKFELRVYGSNLSEFEIYSPWEIEWDIK